MNFIKTNIVGIILCFLIALLATYLGSLFPIVGGPVFAILLGMIICMVIPIRGIIQPGVKFTSKIILQTAVVLLGFGLNLLAIVKTAQESLPIIIVTIATSLIISFVICKYMNIPTKLCTLIGIGSSICGGSAIAATAPVIKANDSEVAQAISVVFFFNVLAALLFPTLGQNLGMSHNSIAFGIFAGTAVNDTSSVTAVASTWDSIYSLGHETLDKAVTVKLTRTLAIIPITIVLSVIFASRHDLTINQQAPRFKLHKIVPRFIVLFVLASLVTSIAMLCGVSSEAFVPLKDLSKFLIVMSMAAVGLNCNLFMLVKTGSIAIFLGMCCWVGITVVCLLLQYTLGIW